MREFCGHGIGRKFHEEPQVLHYGRPGTLDELLPGMIFTIEPMINAGRREIRELGDGWTIVTKDRSLSAQWEHTVLVTDTGYEVLTLSAGSPPPPAFVERLTPHVRRCRELPLPREPHGAAQRGRRCARAFATARRRCWSTSASRAPPRWPPTPADQGPDAPRRRHAGRAVGARRHAGRRRAGGGGRLWPRPSCSRYSDVDVLVLLPAGAAGRGARRRRPTPADALRAAVERFITACWDIGLEIGSSVRTVDECVDAGARAT